MNWLDILAVQGTLKSLLQHHSSKPSILQRSAFFTVQLSHLYMITGKTIALTRWTIVGKVMSLLFNMFFLTLLLSPRVLFPNKISCFVNTCVSSDNSFPVLDKSPVSGPGRGPSSCNKPMLYRDLELAEISGSQENQSLPSAASLHHQHRTSRKPQVLGAAALEGLLQKSDGRR